MGALNTLGYCVEGIMPPNSFLTPQRVQKRTKRTRKDQGDLPPASDGFVRTYVARDPFPSTAMTRSTFCRAFSISTATVAFQCGTDVVFSLNGLFDPSSDSNTHQPYGFDQMAALYRNYLVHAVNIDLEISSGPPWNGTAAFPASALAAFILPSGSSSSPTGLSVDEVEEKPMGLVEWLDVQGRVHRLRQRTFIADLEGLTRQQYRNEIDDYAGTSVANPTKNATLKVAVANLGSTAQLTYPMRVRIEYEVEWFNRITLAASN